MTEPDAGSDLMAMTTRAVERAGRFHLTGRKTWVTSDQTRNFRVPARPPDRGPCAGSLR